MPITVDHSTDEPEAPAESTSPHRSRRWIRRTIVTLVLVTAAFYGLGGWYFASKIQADAFEIDEPSTPEYNVEVLGFEGDSIRLSLDSGESLLTDPGIRGVAWPDGYGRLGDVLSITDDEVLRSYVAVDGTPSVGELLDIEGRAFPGDPGKAHGMEFTSVDYSTPLGPMPAWYVAGNSDSWVVLVHGKGAPLSDTLRVFPVLVDAGYHVLAIEYRNDPSAPRDESEEYGFGTTEWADLEGAVRYSVDHGAESVTLFGFSMGGAIVTAFMANSPVAGVVDAIVFDAPMLDLSRTVDLGGRNSSLPVVGLPLPQSLTSVAKVLAGWRFDIDWSELDYLDRAASLNVPILILHGTDDQTVPIDISRDLAADQPDSVRLVEFEEAGHVLSWNVDPDRYEAEIAMFLEAGRG